MRARQAGCMFMIALFSAAFSRSSLAEDDQDRSASKRSSSKPALLLEASGGPTYGRLYDIPFLGGEGGGGLGIRFPKFALSFDGHYARAESVEGLAAEWGGMRTTLLFTPGRLRVGGGFDVLYLSIDRASSPGSIGHLGVGILAHLGFDVITFDDGGIEIAFVPQTTVVDAAPFLSGSLVAAAHW